jgi:hypothetical protein
MTILRRFDRYWMAPGSARNLALLRILIGGYGVVYLALRGPALVSVAGFAPNRYEPVGIANLAGEPLEAWVVEALVLAAFVAGLALLLLWVTTYRNSFGQIFHTENLLVLHVLVLGFVPSARSLSADSRKDARSKLLQSDDGIEFGWPVRLMCLLTVIAYVIAGVAKLQIGGIEWITGGALQNHVAYDNLRKILLGDWHSPLGAWLVGYGWVFPPLAALTVAFELGAPLALLHRRVAAAWVAGVWVFHLGIFATMAILFPYQMLGFAFLPFFGLERWRVPTFALHRQPAERRVPG